jgi:nitrite reductase/ring-hydroxylating ferredoxin subunit
VSEGGSGENPTESRPLVIRVAGVGQLTNGQSLRFTFQRGKLPEEGFVLRWGDTLQAFANSCPHWSVDLDYGMGDFYDVALDRIVCKNHGALFQPQTGFCEWGPCTGHSLERFDLTLEADEALVSIP